jgi:hypothetical protein
MNGVLVVCVVYSNAFFPPTSFLPPENRGERRFLGCPEKETQEKFKMSIQGPHAVKQPTIVFASWLELYFFINDCGKEKAKAKRVSIHNKHGSYA